MSYYHDQRRAFKDLDIFLSKVLNNQGEIKESLLILEITNRHPVSEKAIRNRLKLLEDSEQIIVNKGVIKKP